MAIYHLNASTGSKAGGQSAAAKVDYVARAGRYKNDRDEVALIQSNHMPNWVQEGSGRAAGAALDYWRQADEKERSNGVLYRQVEFALPVDLPPPERRELALKFAEHLSKIDGGNLPYTIAIHEKPGNPHAHLILSERINDGISRDRETWFKRAAASPKGKEVDPATGGARKANIGSRRKDWLQETRQQWAEIANEALRSKGERIDHRTLAEQNIRRHPTEHLGPQAATLEQKTGGRSRRGQRLDFRSGLQKPLCTGVTTRTPPGRPRKQALEAVQVPALPEVPSHHPRAAEMALEAGLEGVRRGVEAKGRVFSGIPAKLPAVPGIQASPKPALVAIQVPALPAVPARVREAEKVLFVTVTKIKEQKHVTDARRTQLVAELVRSSLDLEARNRGVREGRQCIESAKYPAIQADCGAKCREQAAVRLDNEGQPASDGVLQRRAGLRAAFDGLMSAARGRIEAVKTVAVPLEQAFADWYRKVVAKIGKPPVNGPMGQSKPFPGEYVGEVLDVFQHPEMCAVAQNQGVGWLLHTGVEHPPEVGRYAAIRHSRGKDGCVAAEIERGQKREDKGIYR